MSQSMTLVAMASFGLAALTILALAGLKAWHGWLEVKRLELAGHRHVEPRSQAAPAGARGKRSGAAARPDEPDGIAA